MKYKKSVVAGLALIILSGCGGDGTTGPPEPQNADVEGVWSYDASNLAGTLSGFAVTCSIAGSTMTLIQSGATFSGTSGSGTLTCSAGGITISDPFPTGPVTNGQVDGNNVQFDFGTPDWRHTGTVTGGSMSGSVTIILALEDEVVILNGQWASARQASASLTPLGKRGDQRDTSLNQLLNELKRLR